LRPLCYHTGRASRELPHDPEAHKRAHTRLFLSETSRPGQRASASTDQPSDPADGGEATHLGGPASPQGSSSGAPHQPSGQLLPRSATPCPELLLLPAARPPPVFLLFLFFLLISSIPPTCPSVSLRFVLAATTDIWCPVLRPAPNGA